MKIRSLLLASLAITSSSSLHAQQTGAPPIQTRGLLNNAAHVHSLANAGPDQMYYKRANDQAQPPGALQLSNSTASDPPPDYSMEALFGDWAPYVDIDAFSTGNDFLPMDESGLVTPGSGAGAGGWVAAALSTRSSAQGLPGSWVASRSAAAASGRGADLLSYYFTGSTGIGSAFANQVLLEQSSEHMGFDPQETVEMDAFDAFAAALMANRGAPGGILFNTGGTLYFSVTRASRDAILDFESSNPPPTGEGFFENGAESGATVFQLIRDGNGWSWPPALHHQPGDLGLSDEDDLDAFGYDSSRSVSIFSTRFEGGQNEPASQLMGKHPNNTETRILQRQDPSSPGGRSWVTRGAGLRDTDDVDAVCVFDPEHGSSYSAFFGSPVEVTDLRTMGLAFHRSRLLSPVSSTQDTHLGALQVTGWGNATPSNGVMYIGYALKSSTSNPWNPSQYIQWGAAYPRNASQDVWSIERVIPPPPSVNAGTEIYLLTAFVGNGFEASWPVGTRW